MDQQTGKLTDVPYDFHLCSDHFVNQEAYEKLGEIMTEYIYDILESNGLKRFYLNNDLPKEDSAFVFSTLNEIKHVEKLMIIIHGSGAVRAGQWSRSLIINDSLDAGTVLPYIKRAKKENYEVIVTNTNDNFRNNERIKGSGSPEEHLETVWKNLVQIIDPKVITIVAHSYGGVVTSNIAKKFEDDFNKKVKCVAFTDSVHTRRYTTDRLKEIGVNFVASNKPVNKFLSKNEDEMERRSAGTLKHELTSYSCIDAIFQLIKQKENSPESVF